jgi:hypothetical protein
MPQHQGCGTIGTGEFDDSWWWEAGGRRQEAGGRRQEVEMIKPEKVRFGKEKTFRAVRRRRAECGRL